MCISTTPPCGMTGQDLNLNVYNVEIIYNLSVAIHKHKLIKMGYKVNHLILLCRYHSHKQYPFKMFFFLSDDVSIHESGRNSLPNPAVV